jgi:kynurenine formamidase
VTQLGWLLHPRLEPKFNFMRIRSFIIAYALVLAIILFADRRPSDTPDNRYSHVIDLTGAALSNDSTTTRIIAPSELIPGTWSAGQIPAERLIAPMVVLDVPKGRTQSAQLTLADIADWESKHGVIAQGALIAIRRTGADFSSAGNPVESLPITTDAAQFLMDARYAVGFVVETASNLTSDRALARQIALHGSYVVDGAIRLSDLSETGSLVIVAPAKNNMAGNTVRILAMVR